MSLKQIARGLANLACAGYLLTAGPATAEGVKQINGCHYLWVVADTPEYVVDKVDCQEGEVSERGTNRVVFKQSARPSERIEAEITFANVRPDSTEPNVVRFTQNRCVLKAGNIHVRQVSGAPPIYMDYKGSFKDKRQGVVRVKGFGQNPDKPDWMPNLPE